jgi:hypothetical protein
MTKWSEQPATLSCQISEGQGDNLSTIFTIEMVVTSISLSDSKIAT